LPDDLLIRLSEVSSRLNIPKNKLIQEALSYYLKELDRKKYILSYKKLSTDKDIVDIAEEGGGVRGER
jgi:predicted DNA-binding protein